MRMRQSLAQFEQAFYPGQTHGFAGLSLRNFFQRMTDFFERELQGAPMQGAGLLGT